MILSSSFGCHTAKGRRVDKAERTPRLWTSFLAVAVVVVFRCALTRFRTAPVLVLSEEDDERLRFMPTKRTRVVRTVAGQRLIDNKV